MSNAFYSHVKAQLLKNPGHCYVTDTYLAVFIGEGEQDVLVIAGDFTNASAEEVNQKIIDTINNITKM